MKMDFDRIRDTTITESFRVRPMAVAAAYGHLEMMQEMKSIYGNKQLFDTSTIFYASKYGYQDIINWLRSVDYDFEQKIGREKFLTFDNNYKIVCSKNVCSRSIMTCI